MVHKDSFIAKASFGTTKSEFWYYKQRVLVLQAASFGTTSSEFWYYEQMFEVGYTHAIHRVFNMQICMFDDFPQVFHKYSTSIPQEVTCNPQDFHRISTLLSTGFSIKWYNNRLQMQVDYKSITCKSYKVYYYITYARYTAFYGVLIAYLQCAFNLD